MASYRGHSVRFNNFVVGYLWMPVANNASPLRNACTASLRSGDCKELEWDDFSAYGKTLWHVPRGTYLFGSLGMHGGEARWDVYVS